MQDYILHTRFLSIQAFKSNILMLISLYLLKTYVLENNTIVFCEQSFQVLQNYLNNFIVENPNISLGILKKNIQVFTIFAIVIDINIDYLLDFYEALMPNRFKDFLSFCSFVSNAHLFIKQLFS